MVLIVDGLYNSVLYQEEVDVIASAIEELVFPEPSVFEEKVAAALSVHAISRKDMAEIAKQMEQRDHTGKEINQAIKKSGRVVFLKNDIVDKIHTREEFYANWFRFSKSLIQYLDGGEVNRASFFVPPSNNSDQYCIEVGINCEDGDCVLIFACIYSSKEEICSGLNEGLYGLCCVIKRLLLDDSLNIQSIKIVDEITATAIERRVGTWFTEENYAINSWRELLEKLSQKQDKESK